MTLVTMIIPPLVKKPSVMSKETLSEIIKTPYAKLITGKVGELVRATLPQILELELISELEVKKMTEQDFSKLVFDMNYPVLRIVNENLSILENRSIGEYTRYYAQPHSYKGSRYLISSEWYDRNQEGYIRWLKRKVKLD
jgi:hypothetical protein